MRMLLYLFDVKATFQSSITYDTNIVYLHSISLQTEDSYCYPTKTKNKSLFWQTLFRLSSKTVQC